MNETVETYNNWIRGKDTDDRLDCRALFQNKITDLIDRKSELIKNFQTEDFSNSIENWTHAFKIICANA